MAEEKKYGNFYTAYYEIVQEKELEQKCLSDFTYYVFEKFIFEYIPKCINAVIMQNEEKLTMNFNIKLINDKTFFSISTNHLPTESIFIVEIDGFMDRFMEYIHNIPGTKTESYNCVTFDLKQLIDFYYEELQREEYQTQQSKSR